VAVLGEEAVRVMVIGQQDFANVDTLLSEPAGKRLRRLLAAAVSIGVKGYIHGSPTVAQLPILAYVEMISHRAGDVVEARLPQDGVVEQTLDKNHLRTMPDLLPQIQATLGARQEAVRRRRCRDAAAVEIAFQRKHDAMDECVVASRSD
jgi:hypothetical protein